MEEQSNTNLLSALAQLLQAETSPEMLEIKNLILRRIAEETEVKPSRIPAPLNITEVGGYFNLIDQVESNDPEIQKMQTEMKLKVIASALGLPTR